LDIGFLSLRKPGLQIDNIQIFNRGADDQRICQRLTTLRYQLVIETLQGRVDENPDGIADGRIS